MATTAALPTHAEEATAVAPVQEAIDYVGLSHDEIASSSNAQTFAHTEILNCDTDDVWEACKHAVALLPDLAPEYYSKAELETGNGGPGSISVIHLGNCHILHLELAFVLVLYNYVTILNCKFLRTKD